MCCPKINIMCSFSGAFHCCELHPPTNGNGDNKDKGGNEDNWDNGDKGYSGDEHNGDNGDTGVTENSKDLAM